MTKREIFKDREQLKRLLLTSKLNFIYSSQSPYERMANINANIEMQKVLSKSNEKYANICLASLEDSLNSRYLVGYDYNNEISSPTNRYSNDFISLNILKDNNSFLEQIIASKKLEESKSLYKRLYLGIEITHDEHSMCLKKIKNY